MPALSNRVQPDALLIGRRLFFSGESSALRTHTPVVYSFCFHVHKWIIKSAKISGRA